MSPPITNPHIRAVAAPRARREDGWKRLTIYAGGVAAVLGALAMFASFSWPPWETQEKADTEHAALRAEMKALPSAVAAEVVKQLKEP
jgi:hypothetical protein